jgi:hypothetical protein
MSGLPTVPEVYAGYERSSETVLREDTTATGGGLGVKGARQVLSASLIEPETGEGRAPVAKVPAQVQLADVPQVRLP